MTFTVNFSNLNININTNYDYTYRLCRDYLTDGKPDFTVSPTEEQIDEEIEISEFTPERGYAESICVYREIANNLPFYNRMVFHGAVISYDGNGYIFTAPSGTGKTTHIMLWKKYIEGVEIVNGDKPILWVNGGKITAFATPYAGKEGFQNHSSIDIKGICIIHRLPTTPNVGVGVLDDPQTQHSTLNTQHQTLNTQHSKCNIRRVKTSEFLTEMMAQMYLPPNPEATMKTLDLLDYIVKNIPVYILECDISEEAVKTSFSALTENKS